MKVYQVLVATGDRAFVASSGLTSDKNEVEKIKKQASDEWRTGYELFFVEIEIPGIEMPEVKAEAVKI
jgi:general stress protein 26